MIYYKANGCIYKEQVASQPFHNDCIQLLHQI